MAINIRNPEVGRLARELSRRTGLNMTESIFEALKARLDSQSEEEQKRYLDLKAISSACAQAPDLDTRSEEEILGLDDAGLFGGIIHDHR